MIYRVRWLVLGLAVFLLLVGPARAGTDLAALAEPGPWPVAVDYADWTYVNKDRTLPIKIYRPRGKPGPCPAVIFSHGLGGSRDGYEYLGRHWASHGFISIHVQHPGTDSSIWKNYPRRQWSAAMKAALASPENFTNRPRDISAAVDGLIQANTRPGPLKGLVDIDRIGLAGHSMGAFTVLASAGMRLIGSVGQLQDFSDKRLKAAVTMSPQAFINKKLTALCLADYSVPTLHMTGAKDYSPVSLINPRDRRLTFDLITKADEYFVFFKEADHLVFSGRRLASGRPRPHDEAIEDMVKLTTTLFWQAYLLDSPEARRVMTQQGGGAAALIRPLAEYEFKPQSR